MCFLIQVLKSISDVLMPCAFTTHVTVIIDVEVAFQISYHAMLSTNCYYDIIWHFYAPLHNRPTTETLRW